MAEKIKLLQLSPRFPFPPDDGGKIGIANILMQFAKQGFEVTFFTFTDGNIPDEAIRVAQKYCDLILFEHSTENTAMRILSSVLKNESIYIEKHFPQAAEIRILELARQKDFDAVHADHSCMFPLAKLAADERNIPAGLRLHNIEWMIWQRYADRLPVWHPKRWYVSSQAQILRKNEKNFISQADICFAITDEDKIRAEEMAHGANVVVASAGIEPGNWQPDPDIERDPHQMILATVYKWQHNIDALKWFISEVLPLVRREIPDAKLTLLGKDSPDWLQDLHREGIDLKGYVPEVQPYLNQAGIYIAPLFVGAGIRIKILEAMAMELPVVATPVSTEGIHADEEQGLFVRETPADTAAAIVELMENPDYARKSGISARKFVLGNFSWERNAGIMADNYRKLAGSDQ